MKEPGVNLADLVGVALSTTFTILIYIANTTYGTPGQTDAVAAFTMIMLGVAILATAADDATVLKMHKRPHMVRAIITTNMLFQLVLLLFTGHWVLFLLRFATQTIGMIRVQRARERQEEQNARRVA